MKFQRVGRYAPSPTGDMHLGNARTALLAWLHSRHIGARHLLRFEDLDFTRVRAGAYDSIRADLEWLGLHWDAESRQSDHPERFEAALRRLDTYMCTCSRRDLQARLAEEEAAGAPHERAVVYGGRCRSAGHTEGAVRWRMPHARPILVEDENGSVLVQDPQQDIGDVILRRKDGVFAYHLAVVVDDAASGVTDVVRGADLWESTPLQALLHLSLGGVPPRTLHVPMMHDHRGVRLTKRGGAPSVRQLRESGEAPEELLAELALGLGWRVGPRASLDELQARYSGET